jgi:hypothetical protein
LVDGFSVHEGCDAADTVPVPNGFPMVPFPTFASHSCDGEFVT